MTLSQENFQADCTSWNGYKPCAIQKADDRPDCFGCEQYEAGLSLYDIDSMSLEPELYESADSIGVIEMGGLGSILRTTAVTRAIREINPSINITWYTHGHGAALLKYVPGIIPVNIDEVGPDTRKTVASNLDAIINFESTAQAIPLVMNARRIGGFALNAQGKFYGANSYAEYFQRLQIDDGFRLNNRLTMQQILLQSVGLGDYEAKYDVTLGDENRAQAKQILHRAFGDDLPNQIVGLNIGTSENGRVRRWPAEYHVDLAKRLADTHPGVGVTVLSGPQDDKVRKRVVDGLTQSNDNIAVLPNNLEIGDFMAVVSNLGMLVTSNSFALHAARSQDVRVVTFENPLPPQEMELSALDIRHGPKLNCGPCYNRCTQPTEGQCMNEITSQEVMSSVERLLTDKV